MRRVAVLGSTGSVGTQALDVIRRHPDSFSVAALVAGTNRELLTAQAQEFGVPADRVCSGLDTPAALAEFAALTEVDVVLNAVVGFAGLPATISALQSGKRLALANKESLIAGGPIVKTAREAGGGEIVPVDSEHSAIYQALRSGKAEEVSKIILTASGGPFRGYDARQLATVKVADALQHPTWNMGAKITIDSSTLMNKGLEVIEAHELFGLDYNQIDVVVHPQSIVHSMVEFCDGSVIAQLSPPDMRLPIGLALAAPDRLDESFGNIDFAQLGSLTFAVPDRVNFPSLDLAYEAGRAGGGAPAALSAANEVAVAAFLAEKISWEQICEVNTRVLAAGTGNINNIADVLEVDQLARSRAQEVVTQFGAI